MTAFATTQELKNRINAAIYANDTGLITAEDLQECLHDVIDTLESLSGSGADISALESENDLEQIYAGNDKVATELWVAAQDFLIGSQKGAANGIAPLDSGGRIPAGNLPSYVDDVIEYANLAALEAVAGEQGKIYVTLDTNKQYRWSGSVYIEISGSSPAASSLVTTNFSISEEGGKLVFKYGSTVIASLSSAGYLKVKDEWEGFVAAP